MRGYYKGSLRAQKRLGNDGQISKVIPSGNKNNKKKKTKKNHTKKTKNKNKKKTKNKKKKKTKNNHKKRIQEED